MKATRFLLAAGVLLALAFMFVGCTSDDGSSDRYTCQLPAGGCIEATVSTCSDAGGFVVATCQEQNSSSSSAIDVISSSSAEVVNSSSSAEAESSSSSAEAESSSSSVEAESSSSSVEAVSSSSAVEVSSSSIIASSSSSVYSSSSSGVAKETFTDERDGKTYGKVVVGNQTWMAENLNYKPDTVDSWCYDDDPAKCEICGRLYDWNTALTICPDGWHLPTREEWDEITNYAGGSATSGIKLAVSSWKDMYGLASGDGTDDYGFSALPCGMRYNDRFGQPNQAHWWSSSERGPNTVSYRRIGYGKSDDAYWNPTYKEYGLSVRCVEGRNEIVKVPFTDGRDGKTYEAVVIGTQTWMAENLNYYVNGSKCYDDQDSNCETYGRLYGWATAMEIDTSYNTSSWGGSDVKHRGICPVGWHIPSDAEWTTLRDYLVSDDSGVPARKLKATTGWNSNVNDGRDIYGFAALPGGYYDGGTFRRVGEESYWWSATEASSSVRNAYYWNIINYGISYNGWSKAYMYSIRCIQD
jgi:uncharacterized protein (TIGR02145 family)